MTKLAFYQTLHAACGEEYCLRAVAYAACAVLEGIKPAELVTLPIRHCARSEPCGVAEASFAALPLHSLELSRGPRNALYLFYDEAMLTDALAEHGRDPLLQAAGYPPSGTLHAMLSHLKARFRADHFPHEIGLFLGYPARDVHAFIAQGGKGFQFSSYWKVYHDVERARALVKRIDCSKRKTLSLMGRMSVQHTIRTLHATKLNDKKEQTS